MRIRTSDPSAPAKVEIEVLRVFSEFEFGGGRIGGRRPRPSAFGVGGWGWSWAGSRHAGLGRSGRGAFRVRRGSGRRCRRRGATRT